MAQDFQTVVKDQQQTQQLLKEAIASLKEFYGKEAGHGGMGEQASWVHGHRGITVEGSFVHVCSWKVNDTCFCRHLLLRHSSRSS